MNNIVEELARLVYDYSINSKFADKKFVNKVIELYVKELDVDDYVCKSNIISDVNDGVLASYNVQEKNIEVNVSALNNTVLSRINCETLGGIVSSKFLKYVKVNLGIISSIVHELSHAYQYKKCLSSNTKDLERELLEMSLKKNLSLLRNEEITPKIYTYYQTLDSIYHDDIFYKSLPSERMAEINGLELENNISQQIISKRKDNLDDYTKARLLISSIDAYMEYSPTAFVAGVNESIKRQVGLPYSECDMSIIEQIYKQKAKANHLSLDEKLYYGLPIERYDLNYINMEIESLKRSMIK